MQPIWIALFSVDYEGGGVIGIYTTERKAENALKRFTGYCNEKWTQEMTLNKDLEQGDINV